MNENRISKLVHDLFYDVVETDKVREQKEELRIHLTERVSDYMAEGLNFEDALHAAREGLGDSEELTNGFERKRAVVFDDVDDDLGVNIQFRLNKLMLKLVPLSPFIYILLGATQRHWYPEHWNWNFWAWGWVIIPVFAILSNGFKPSTIVSLSPFIYILLGIFMGWWLWGWIIIPVCAILFSASGSDKKRKKRKNRPGKSIRVRYNFDRDLGHNPMEAIKSMNNIDKEINKAMKTVREELYDALETNQIDVSPEMIDEKINRAMDKVRKTIIVDVNDAEKPSKN